MMADRQMGGQTSRQTKKIMGGASFTQIATIQHPNRTYRPSLPCSAKYINIAILIIT